MNSGNATAILTPTPARAFSPKPGNALTIMVLHTQDRSIADLMEMLRGFGYNVAWSTTLSDGLAGLHTIAVPVVICERKLPDGSWKDLVQRISSFEPPPLVIVSDWNADDRLWADVLSAGAYDLLPEPFEVDEVIRSLSLAIQYWQETQIFRQSSRRLRSHMRRSA
jgi:DNA-binding NtrC family response regulator